MNRIFLTLLALTIGIAYSVAVEASSETGSGNEKIRLNCPPFPLSRDQQSAYNVGWRLGEGYHQRGIILTPEIYIKSFLSSLRGDPSLVEQNERLFHQAQLNRQARARAYNVSERVKLPDLMELNSSISLDSTDMVATYSVAYLDAQPYLLFDFSIVPQGFAAGFINGYFGERPLMTVEIFAQHTAGWERDLRACQVAANEAAGSAGAAFAAEFLKTHADAIKLPSGVIYRVIRRGQGPLPDGNDMLRVHYVARRVDGSIFEDTRQLSEEPAGMPVPGMLPGMKEVLTREPSGTHIIAVLPGASLFGPNWSAELPGNSTLIYDLTIEELVSYPGETP